MYLLFRDHHMSPSTYFNMEPGEQIILRAFMHYEIEERKKEMDSLRGDF